MFKKAAWWSAAAVLLLALGACGNAETNGAKAPEQETTKQITDVMGHQVVYPAQPKRVLAPYLEDPLAVLGVKPVAQTGRAGGVPEYDYLQEWMKDVPVFDLGATGLTYENVLSFQPDLFFLFHPGFAQQGKYEAYSKIAPTFVLDNQSDWRKTLRTMGGMLNKADVAEQAIADYDSYAKQAAGKLAQAIGNERVAVMSLGKGTFTLWGAAFWSGNVLYRDLRLNQPQLVSGKDIVPNQSWEVLTGLQDADRIFLIDQDGDVRQTGLSENAVWNSLPAVKKHQVYEMTGKHWMINGSIASRHVIGDVLKALGE